EGRVAKSARNRLIQAGAYAKKSFERPLAGQKLAVAFVGVSGDQGGGVCIGACQNQRGNVTNIGGQSCGNEVCDGSARRNQHFSPHVSAFFLARELIFEVHASCARRDHRLDQFKYI